MISIDIGELKDELRSLQEFLEKKLSVKIKVEDKTMNMNEGEESLSRSKVKDCMERFFYRKGLADTYKVRSEKDMIKIVKKK